MHPRDHWARVARGEGDGRTWPRTTGGFNMAQGGYQGVPLSNDVHKIVVPKKSVLHKSDASRAL